MADESGRPEIFTPIGGAALIGALVVVGTSASTGSPWPLIIVPFLIVPGVWGLVAPYKENWWLPGRAELRRKIVEQHNKEARLATNRDEALEILNLYVRSSFIGKTNTGFTAEQFTTWYLGLQQFVTAAYGSHEEALITAGEEVWTTDVQEVFTMVNRRVARLAEKASTIDVREDFDPALVRRPEWLVQATQEPTPFGQYFGPPTRSEEPK